jgi:uncharacterized delta-60 repeat protein
MLQKCVILMITCCFPFFSAGQAGLLDSTFGDFGKVVFPTNQGYITGGITVPLPDEKILVLWSQTLNNVEQLTITRLLSNGTIDENFGDFGHVFPDISAEELYVRDAVLTPDGQIVAVGSILINNVYGLIILKLEQDGSFSGNFGSSGFRIFNTGGEEDELFSVKVKPDGGVITCGYTIDAITEFASGLFIQLLSDGTDDNNFGSAGLLKTDFHPANEGFFGLDMQSDGKIVASGAFGLDELDMMVARFLPDGSLDNSFGENGLFKFGDPTRDEYLFDILVDADQKIVTYGQRSDLVTEQNQLALFKLESDGTFDATFGSNGRVFKSVATINSISKLQKQPDGKYLVSGASFLNNGTLENILWVFRYNNDGTTDETFGQLGGYTTPPLTAFPEVTDLVLQTDNKILIAAILENSLQLIRLQADMIIETKIPIVFNLNLAISPNPIQKTAILSWNMEQKAPITCELLDVQGRVVQTIYQDETFLEGNQQNFIFWKNDLPLGNYFLKMTIGNRVESLSVVKVY